VATAVATVAEPAAGDSSIDSGNKTPSLLMLLRRRQ